MADANAVFNRSPNIVSRNIEGETILVPIHSSEDEVDSIYMLNEIAGFIWERLDGKTSAAQISESIADEYSVTSEKASKDTRSLLEELKKLGCIE